MHRRMRRFASPLLVGLTLVTAAVAGTFVYGSAASADDDAPKPTIVLVHGAWADVSGWSDVTHRLQDAGYEVIAPANPLRGLPDDVAYLGSALATIQGPVVLVGHSYGGMVMTGAATGNPNVHALVYVAAFAPRSRRDRWRVPGDEPRERARTGHALVPTALWRARPCTSTLSRSVMCSPMTSRHAPPRRWQPSNARSRRLRSASRPVNRRGRPFPRRDIWSRPKITPSHRPHSASWQSAPARSRSKAPCVACDDALEAGCSGPVDHRGGKRHGLIRARSLYAGARLSSRGVGLVGRSVECEVLDAGSRLRSSRLEPRHWWSAARPASARRLSSTMRSGAAPDFLVIRFTGIESESELGYAALHRLLTPVLHQIQRLPEPQRDAMRSALGLAAGAPSNPFLVGLGTMSLAANAAPPRTGCCA